METNKLVVVKCLDKYEVACYDADVLACLYEDVLGCLDKNKKHDFDIYFLL